LNKSSNIEQKEQSINFKQGKQISNIEQEEQRHQAKNTKQQLEQKE
jgi:hypothetical protein